MEFYRYSGAGNSFVVIDGRNCATDRFRKKEIVHALCMQNDTDGLMILENSDVADFKMLYFNRDGSGGMMCGNGGRCIVAFADLLGVKPFHTADYAFEAPDGVIHRATILSHLGEMKTVRLEMKDVEGMETHPDGIFLDTGTRHFTVQKDNVAGVDVENEGRALRFDPRFSPQGTNVDFWALRSDGDGVDIRTFEKGVEAETLACGTGIVAAALASALPSPVNVHALKDILQVEYRRDGDARREVYLTGPTLCEGSLIE